MVSSLTICPSLLPLSSRTSSTARAGACGTVACLDTGEDTFPTEDNLSRGWSKMRGSWRAPLLLRPTTPNRPNRTPSTHRRPQSACHPQPPPQHRHSELSAASLALCSAVLHRASECNQSVTTITYRPASLCIFSSLHCLPWRGVMVELPRSMHLECGNNGVITMDKITSNGVSDVLFSPQSKPSHASLLCDGLRSSEDLDLGRRYAVTSPASLAITP
ncbi:hypothetical protein F5884DRAFT_402694 [Xylogone sp. PMI_703]|nr:hypothetical protein F5884DRAFT_402694 [Xylogone sp. PMI_703]